MQKNNSIISVIIPIKNEAIHIARAVKSALRLTPNVFVVDSSSTDDSITIAHNLGAQVYQYDWVQTSNFSKKINWALKYLPLQTTWVIRLDADEYFLDNCIEKLENALSDIPSDINGCTIIRRIHFLGRWMKHSNEYPKTTLRIMRVGCTEMEDRWLDEHVDLKGGKSIDLPFEIVDDNKTSLSNWINKHNNVYAIREAIELINQEINLFNRDDSTINIDPNAQKKKRHKSFYAKQPKYWRAFFFFCYRYFFKLGILDGKQGFLWNFFQCWWYRTLADAKVDEIYDTCGKDKEKIIDYIKKEYGIDCSKK